MAEELLCPCCRKAILAERYDICPVCGWEYDPVQQQDPAFAGGANNMSLMEAIEDYEGRMEQVKQQEAEISCSESATESCFDEVD